jgi:hypothetical protein
VSQKILDRVEPSDVKLNADQRAAVIALVEETPWADIAGAMISFEEALRIALERTTSEFAIWHDYVEERGFDDECDRLKLRDLPSGWRPALIARLLRSMALMYGLGTEFGAKPLGEPCDNPWHLRSLLRRLDAIVSSASRR